MTDGHGADPLTVPAPSFDADRAAALADRAYGITGTLSELGGERDQNFEVETPGGERYVLKISNPVDDESALDLQTAAMRHIAETDPDLPVMTLQETVTGDPWTTIEADGREHLVRLFTFVPGRIASPTELDHEALAAYGGSVARVGRALRGFFHPEARYDILWDLRHTPRLRTHLDAIEDDARRDLATRVLDRFDDRVTPSFAGLRAQVVHNDLTFSNVLFGDDDRVSGVVDFGDLTHTALVCDLAIAIASAMFGRDDPLEAAESVTRGYAAVTRLEDDEASILADLVAARLAAWVSIAAWRVDLDPENEAYITAGLDTAWALLETLDRQGWDRVGRRLRTAARSANVHYDSVSTDELAARRRGVLGDSPLSYRDPLHVIGGEGVWLHDRDGRRYLDAYNNVQVVGHANRTVADAIGGQARTLATNTRYLHEAAVELGDRLTATMPAGLDTVIFVNSGSEANEVAWRLATANTDHEGAIVTDHAYHGITEATSAMSPESWPADHEPDWVETVPPPVETTARDPVEGMRNAIAALETDGTGVGAFVFDSLFTSDGIHPPTGELLTQVADEVRAAGGLVVADEVQAGFGRTGDDLWGFESAGVVPDVVTLGKPMGNGHPVAAVVTRSALAETLRDRTGLFSTFGGNPVSASAALAVLDVVQTRGLVDQARATGTALRAGLEELAATHDTLGSVRGTGLMCGVSVTDAGTGQPSRDEAAAIVNALRDRGVLIGTTGPQYGVLKIRPPLVFDRTHADQLIDAMESVLTERDS